MTRRTGLLAGMLAAIGLVVVGAASTAASPPGLVEAAVCAHPTPLPAVTDARTDGATVVSFAVPNETRLRLDPTGDVLAASTNTGCRPRAADTVVVVTDDGRRPATPTEIDQALTRFPTGDWREPGVWHPAA